MRTKALALFLLLALSGCSALPTSGPVLVAGPQNVTDDDSVQYLPAGPAEGATQREILDGFLAAGAAAQENYRISRSFLTDQFANEWDPTSETLVRGTSIDYVSTSAESLSVTTPILARIARGGVYTDEKLGATQRFDFEFTEVGGEWRISGAPDAVLMGRSTFESAFQPYSVFFYNSDRSKLIPEIRYFPRQGDPATRVARAVIAGPSIYLPHASTAFPAGSALVASPIDVVDGRALVDVTGDVLEASADDQRAMLVEMTASLTALPSITSVDLTVDRTLLPISIFGSSAMLDEPIVNDNPAIVSGGVFGFVSGSQVDPVAPLGNRILELAPLSISFDGSVFAAVGTASGVYRVGAQTALVANQRSVTEPQIDDAGGVWWVRQSSPSAITVWNSGNSQTISGPWNSTAQIVALEVSREGSRVAIALNSSSGPALYVASVDRDAAGAVRAIAGFHELPIGGNSVIDIAWADSVSVAVITENIALSYVELASVGGITEVLGTVDAPIAISGGNGSSQLVVLSSSGQLFVPRSGGWQTLGVTAELLATQR
ncbi:unannotated protein [freshwater metagenome]|uniref:Unannotated protein n=1 Tax=freshwater metagenome TaxID=449393 RepID=A0A6J6FAJ0_9ZZZZ